MAKKTTAPTATGTAKLSDNYDPGARAETIRTVFDAMAKIASDRSKAIEKYKQLADIQKGKLKGLGFKMADVAPAIRIHELKNQAENADSVEDRKKAENRIAMSVATFTECYAAIEETAQLDFNQILEAGDAARKSAADSDNTAPFQEDAPRETSKAH